MKKIFLSLAVTLAFGFYVYFQRVYSAEPGDIITDTSETSASSEPSPIVNSAPYATTVTLPTGQYKNGNYKGSVADAFYGLLQVQAVISGGKLTDVKFLKYPDDRPTSVEINKEAIPVLRSEAIRAQSANVDIVTGATQSSEAFQQSLAVALSAAKN